MLPSSPIMPADMASMPSANNTRAELRPSKPYVHAQITCSTLSPRAGNTRTEWLTGASAWSYYIATQYLLGIQPEAAFLRIDPCIPSAWDGFSVRRRYRGQLWKIVVHNPEPVCKGVRRVLFDGEHWQEKLLPADRPGDEHAVEIRLGKTTG